MADVLSIKNNKDGRVLIELEMGYEEFLKLKGSVDNVHLFSEDSVDKITTLTQRGSNEATKYFLIPKELRENLKIRESVKCQRLEIGNNIFFIYMLKK